MEFGIKIREFIILKRGKVDRIGEWELSSGEIIKAIDSGKSYKYLGILEADDVLQKTIKDVFRKEYYKRIRHLTSKLNVIAVINSLAASLLMRYGAGVSD